MPAFCRKSGLVGMLRGQFWRVYDILASALKLQSIQQLPRRFRRRKAGGRTLGDERAPDIHPAGRTFGGRLARAARVRQYT